jgi:hypothetical protein
MAGDGGADATGDLFEQHLGADRTDVFGRRGPA